uniref:RNA polymerase II subunit B1 CTD phosphatase RPAP2 homolog n=1 Tax=Ditylenchus dipsaci TaxID=166011 RepID=A0A915EQP5_9BILA
MLPKNVKINEEGLQKRLAQERERIRLEEQRRRSIYTAICDLCDPVTEEVLMENLKVLDVASWNEVVEERFLGRICGLPTCSNSIAVDFSKKFVIDKKRKMVFGTDSELNKYCSDNCLGISRGIQSQLWLEPLWATGEREPKQFTIPTNSAEFLSDMKAKASSFQSAPQIVKRLNDLRILDRVESSSDSEVENKEEDERDEREFLPG